MSNFNINITPIKVKSKEKNNKEKYAEEMFFLINKVSFLITGSTKLFLSPLPNPTSKINIKFKADNMVNHNPRCPWLLKNEI
jgi:hypothetical protein